MPNASDNVVALHCEFEMGSRAAAKCNYICGEMGEMGDGRGSVVGLLLHFGLGLHAPYLFKMTRGISISALTLSNQST